MSESAKVRHVHLVLIKFETNLNGIINLWTTLCIDIFTDSELMMNYKHHSFIVYLHTCTTLLLQGTYNKSKCNFIHVYAIHVLE